VAFQGKIASLMEQERQRFLLLPFPPLSCACTAHGLLRLAVHDFSDTTACNTRGLVQGSGDTAYEMPHVVAQGSVDIVRAFARGLVQGSSDNSHAVVHLPVRGSFDATPAGRHSFVLACQALLYLVVYLGSLGHQDSDSILCLRCLRFPLTYARIIP
jgi:hypothetical protein